MKRSKLCLLILTVLLLAGCGGSESKSSMAGMHMSKNSSPSSAHGQASAAPGGGSFLHEPISDAVLNTELFDASGKTFTLASLKGKVLVVSDFLTSCQEICPMTSANMRAIGDAVSKANLKDKIKVLEISVDSGRDSAGRLAAYQELFQDYNWVLASGKEKSLKTLWDFFGAAVMKSNYTAEDMKTLPVDWQTGKPNTYDVAHADEVLIIDASGNWAWVDLGNPNPQGATIPAKLNKFLSADGLANLAKPQEPSWTPEAVLSALSSIVGIDIKP
ncbi:MAG: SCO family protein [Actinomycetes bacterium]